MNARQKAKLYKKKYEELKKKHEPFKAFDDAGKIPVVELKTLKQSFIVDEDTYYEISPDEHTYATDLTENAFEQLVEQLKPYIKTTIERTDSGSCKVTYSLEVSDNKEGYAGHIPATSYTWILDNSKKPDYRPWSWDFSGLNPLDYRTRYYGQPWR